MNRPWMPLYVADYLAETEHLSAAESGAYLHLLMHYWRHGSLPQDDRHLGNIIRSFDGVEWARIKPRIAPLFGLGWTHTKLDVERKKLRAGGGWGVPAQPAGRCQTTVWREARRRIFVRDDYTCGYCGQRGGALECDHVIPVSRGGTDDDSNLITSCKPCNRAKGALTPDEWAA